MSEVREMAAVGQQEQETVTLADLKADIIAALQGRAVFYDLLAYLYFRPLTAEQIENIAVMDMSAYDGINDAMSEGFNDMHRYLNKRNTGTRQELAVDFTATFAGTSSWKGCYATPYESVFTSEDGLMCREAYHEVYTLFRQNGVALADGYDYPDDHLSFMCEFLSVISHRTIDALNAGDYNTALENMNLSKDFVNDHILSWFDKFAELASLMLTTRFYRGVLKASKGFFVEDMGLVASIAVTLEEMIAESGE